MEQRWAGDIWWITSVQTRPVTTGHHPHPKSVIAGNSKLAEVVLWCRYSNFLSKQTEPETSFTAHNWSIIISESPGPGLGLVTTHSRCHPPPRLSCPWCPGPRINNDRTSETPATITFFSVTNWWERGAGNWISTMTREFPIRWIFLKINLN